MKTVKNIKSRTHKLQKVRHQKAKRLVRRTRPMHKRVLLHPITFFILLCLGVFIVNWTFRAAADQYVITAKVAAPSLIEGATITEPINGAVFIVSSTTVKGTCPTNSYVVLYRNSAMSGVAWCDSNNNYAIATSLYPGTNTLKVQDFNITDDPGPITPEINVTYVPPIVKQVVNTPVGGQATGVTATVNLPQLSSDFTYQTFATNTNFSWSIDVLGGVPSYQLVTNWGDGTTSTQTVSKAQKVTINHRFKSPGVYVITIKITDSNGNISMLQLMAFIKSPGSVITTGNVAQGGGTASFWSASWLLLVKHWLVIAWGSYATVMLMTVSFWLGEQQKVAALVNIKKVTHHRRKVSRI